MTLVILISQCCKCSHRDYLRRNFAGLKSLKLLILLVCWYSNTSFQVSNTLSVEIQPKEFVEEESFTPLFYKKVELFLAENKTYKLDLGQSFTAVKINQLDSVLSTIAAETGFEKLTFGKPQLDENIDIPASFVVFKKQTNLLVLHSTQSTTVEIELFYAPPVQVALELTRNKKADCDKPITIPQSQWRAGLPEPDSGRNAVVVKHCIIHHSAGSNTDTNYLNTVRNIYLLHTQSNGWDDIGYNFVIAPNGVIFSGRDAQGVADEDNIQGAHFCAKNGGTMGVCLLGNYNLISPTPSMQNSLNDLLSWKLHKEDIAATASFPHPTGLDDDLGSIAMHRDGCPTACPGDSVALLLNDIKYEVQQLIDECNGSVAVEKPVAKFKQMVYPNPSTGKFYALIEKSAGITKYRIIDQQGKEIENNRYPNTGKIVVDVPSGTYYLELWNNETKISSQVILIENQ